MENENKSALATRRAQLKRAIMIRLNAFGGYAWESPRTSSGLPHINFIWGGVYYGFYISGCVGGKGNSIADPEYETMRKMNEAGAQVAVIGNLDSF
jgi:hypothetical protein